MSFLTKIFSPQNPKYALERTGWRTHVVPAKEWAARCADYAALCANVYGSRGYKRIGVPAGWVEVAAERVDDKRTGLYYEVWERVREGSVQVAVTFRGTQFTSLKDWRSNLRWFLRWLPGKDQYDVVREQIAGVVERARQRHGGAVVVVATGHSLGGGLAQQAAYAHAEIKQVFAFDPSPVTGFRSVPNPARDLNKAGISVMRIFEHGEILAYLRLVLKYLVPLSLRDPAIVEVRLNLRDGDPINLHSMGKFAKLLNRALYPHKAGMSKTASQVIANP